MIIHVPVEYFVHLSWVKSKSCRNGSRYYGLFLNLNYSSTIIFLTFLSKYAASLPLAFININISSHSRVIGFTCTLQIPWTGRANTLPSGWNGPCRSLDWMPLICLSFSSLAPSCCHSPKRNSSKELRRSQGMYSTLTLNYCRREVVSMYHLELNNYSCVQVTLVPSRLTSNHYHPIIIRLLNLPPKWITH